MSIEIDALGDGMLLRWGALVLVVEPLGCWWVWSGCVLGRVEIGVA